MGKLCATHDSDNSVIAEQLPDGNRDRLGHAEDAGNYLRAAAGRAGSPPLQRKGQTSPDITGACRPTRRAPEGLTGGLHTLPAPMNEENLRQARPMTASSTRSHGRHD